MSKKFENFISNNIDSFNEMNPDPKLFNKIKRQINQKKKIPKIYFLKWTVAASLIMLLGLGLSQLLENIKNISPISKVDIQYDSIMKSNNSNYLDTTLKTYKSFNEPKTLKSGIQRKSDFRIEFINGMLNEESASTRFKAASSIAELKKTDFEIIDILFKTMNNDPNTNVRFASLNALSRFSHEKYVKQKLIESLAIQKDPIIQIALIELLADIREKNFIDHLIRITIDENIEKSVKDQAYRTLLILHT